MATRIVTDSASDLPPGVAEEFGIQVIPLLVQFGTTTFRDRVDLSPGEFYTRLAGASVMPTTATAAPGAFAEVYQQLIATGDNVASIHVAAKLSGVWNTARIAAAEFPNKVAVLDSANATMGQGLLTIAAARAAREGAGLAEVAALCERAAPRLRVWAVLDTLEYLQRGGRIGQARALLGSLLKVKPILVVKDGAVLPEENVRTLRKAVTRLIELVQAVGRPAELAVIHTAAPPLAEEVRTRLAELYPGVQIWVSEAGPVVGTHAGPGAVGVAARPEG